MLTTSPSESARIGIKSFDMPFFTAEEIGFSSKNFSSYKKDDIIYILVDKFFLIDSDLSVNWLSVPELISRYENTGFISILSKLIIDSVV